MTQEELKLVFDALKQCNTYAFAGGFGVRATAHTDALAILEKALAQPEQEPNWAWTCNECGAQEFTLALCKADLDYLACSGCGSNEFHKEALAQEQEPVCDKDPQGCWNVRCQLGKKCKNTPPAAQRTWVGLTDEQIDACWNKTLWKEKQPHHIFAKAIEAKLKDKNS